MKTISGPLTTLLNSNSIFAKADLYTWTLVDGSIIRTTDADVNLSWSGNTFLSEKPATQRSKVTLTVGIEVDSLDISIFPSSTDTLAGLSWQSACRQGYLDGATLLVETAYIQTWPTVVGVIHQFQGLVSEVFPERTVVRVTVKSALELLTQRFPRNVYQSVCGHTLYSAPCGAVKATFTFTGTVSASPAPTTTSIKTGHAQAAGYFDNGVLTFTSGALNGLKRTVKKYDPATGFTWALPLPSAPTTGTTVSVFAGCDHTLETCRSKFSNDIRFRGFPYVPNPEMGTPPIPSSQKAGK